jgi:hypothetical protein
VRRHEEHDAVLSTAADRSADTVEQRPRERTDEAGGHKR